MDIEKGELSEDEIKKLLEANLTVQHHEGRPVLTTQVVKDKEESTPISYIILGLALLIIISLVIATLVTSDYHCERVRILSLGSEIGISNKVTFDNGRTLTAASLSGHYIGEDILLITKSSWLPGVSTYVIGNAMMLSKPFPRCNEVRPEYHCQCFV
jgi:hypothetical protein